MTYTAKTPAVIKEQSRLHFVTRREADDSLQALMIDASYHALCGNSDPLNFLLEDARVNNAVRIAGITLWVELNLPVRIKDEKFKMNKGWTASEVKSEEEFGTVWFKKLTDAPKFYEVVRKERVESVWSADTYLNRVIDTLTKNGRPDLAKEVLAVKGLIEQGVPKKEEATVE